MVTDGSTERDLGRLGALMEQFEKALQRQNADLLEKIEGLEAKIDNLEKEIAGFNVLLAQFKGGSKVAFAIGSVIGGGVGAAVLKYGALFLAK